MMRPVRRKITLPVAFWMAFLTTGLGANADSWPTSAGSIRISDAFATEAEAGSCTDIRILIENESGETLQLLGIETEIGKTSRAKARVGDKKSAILESIPIPADEAVSTLTSHLSFPVCDLLKTLSEGQSFPAILIFSSGRMATYVHVQKK